MRRPEYARACRCSRRQHSPPPFSMYCVSTSHEHEHEHETHVSFLVQRKSVWPAASRAPPTHHMFRLQRTSPHTFAEIEKRRVIRRLIKV
jgi:hypothetical protein